MLMFDRGKSRFVYRVAGIALRPGEVLIHRAETDDFWALPGGRVEFFESSLDTLKREMQEELGVDVHVGRLLWVVENFFKHEGQDCHEVGLYFLMSFPSGSKFHDTQGSFEGTEEGVKLIYQWHPLEQLDSLDLRPSFLRDSLKQVPDIPHHIIQPA